jgi:hypothetical protein
MGFWKTTGAVLLGVFAAGLVLKGATMVVDKARVAMAKK